MPDLLTFSVQKSAQIHSKLLDTYHVVIDTCAHDYVMLHFSWINNDTVINL
jgi:hypothetical protein